jgi:hypothetical protein
MCCTDSSSSWKFTGFDIINVPMDGNCMFASIAHQLYALAIDTELRTANDVRTEVVNFLRADSSLAASICVGLDEGLQFYCLLDEVG